MMGLRDDGRERWATRRVQTALTALVLPVLATMLLAITVLAATLSLLAATLLVSATAGPAAAANSAAEYLSGTGERPFGGVNRYYTASALAEQLIRTHDSGLEFVDTLIVASGDRGAVDAAVASGLAGSRNAAVLLTESNRLNPLVTSFIKRNLIREVIVLGGTEAVSAAVHAELGGATRIAGANRIATSVAVAYSLGEPGDYCDTGQVSAILVSANSLVDAAMVAPLAYKSSLPILFTQPDSLAPEVAQYLADAAIEHVLVMGGTAEISDAVVAAVQNDGLVATTRIAEAAAGESDAQGAAAADDSAAAAADGIAEAVAAESAAAAADDIAEAAAAEAAAGDTATAVADPIARSAVLARALQQCSLLSVADNTFALVDVRNPVDAAAAGPPLGAGLGAPSASTGLAPSTVPVTSTAPSASALVPILLVDSTLPSTTSLLLEEIPRQDSAGSFVSAHLVAIGGTERVSQVVMEAARDAAATSPALTARISINAGSNKITILFSDEVTDGTTEDDTTESVAGLAKYDVKTRGNYLLSGTPLLDSDSFTTNGRTLTIVLNDYTVQAGDTIEVAHGVIKGAGNDNRTVKGARVAAAALAPDSTRPLLRLELAQQAQSVVVLVDEANPFGVDSKALVVGDVSVTRADGRNVLLAADGVKASIDGLRYEIALADTLRLQAGDIVRVAAGAVKDAAGRSSRTRHGVVVPNSNSPRVITASITKSETMVDPGADGVVGSFDDFLRNANLRVAQGALEPGATPGLDSTWQACASSPDTGSPDVAGPDTGSPDTGSPDVAGPDTDNSDTGSESCRPEFELRARPNGRESGVAGNRWSLQLNYDAAVGATNGEPASEIRIDTSLIRAIISVTYDNEARVSDVITALRADDAVVSRFEIIDTNEAANPLLRVPGAIDQVTLGFAGGASRVQVTLTYNEVIASFNGIDTASPAAVGDITGQSAAANSAGGAALTHCTAPTAPSTFAGDPRLGGALKLAQINPAWAGSSDNSTTWDIVFDPPSSTAVITLTSSAQALPTVDNVLVLPATLGVNFDCAASAAVDDQRLRVVD